MITIYGIKNCDTMKKAMRWLDDKNIDYAFHDYRKDGLDEELLKSWISELGWETVINKRGTTWRKLDEELKSNMDDSTAVKALIEQPAMIKRPLLTKDSTVTLGFKPEEYQAIFS